MNAVTIREMFPEDIPVIAAIERASFTAPWSETSFYSEVYNRNSITRVGEFNGEIVGYICIKMVVDECHLLDLAVHPDYRRRGIAKMLFNNALKDLEDDGCRRLYLEVRAANFPAKIFYEKLGFKTIGMRKNYYLNPQEDALIMMIEISHHNSSQST